MAALTAPNVIRRRLDNYAGTDAKLLTLECRKVNAGDTIDVSAWMAAPVRAMFIGVTVSAFAVATVSGTTVTVPNGASNDAAMLVVAGS